MQYGFFFLMRFYVQVILEFEFESRKRAIGKKPGLLFTICSCPELPAFFVLAEEQGTFNMADISTGIDYSLLKGPTEIALTKLLLDFPETIESCAMHFEPHRLTTYLQDIAAAFHRFYHEHRIVIPELDIAKATACALSCRETQYSPMDAPFLVLLPLSGCKVKALTFINYFCSFFLNKN